ncbi:MAG: cryptochrome/photolyase family protein [Leptospira sp.]|nr:cryptochrome/photolyase family protein [Leptospira sp.]
MAQKSPKSRNPAQETHDTDENFSGNPGSSEKWIYINYDQLSRENPLLQAADPKTIHIVFVETSAKPAKRPYHKQKLILLISAMRHFAKELRQKGYNIHSLFNKDGYKSALQKLQKEQKMEKIHCLEIQELEVRSELEQLPFIEFHPNTLYLSDRDEWLQIFPGDIYPSKKKYLHETFYRFMRKKYNILLDENEKPIGGKWNLDHENRSNWTKKDPLPPPIPWIKPDNLTQEVIAQIDKYYPDSFGSSANFGWPVTRKDSLIWLEHFVKNSLLHFGRYEDAMDIEEPYLFHSLLSPLIHLGLLHPWEVITRALQEYEMSLKRKNESDRIPLASIEGFIRQILGWREYMRHIYLENSKNFNTGNYFGHKNPLPPVYWGKKSGMRCMDSIIETVWNRGYSHHITRLMVLSNFANLMNVSPHALNEWFWIGYTDAYEWVVTPNVVGMGTHADGGITATKPYIASANYIKKMAPSYCKACKFKANLLLEEDACPFNALYWNFIGEHASFYSKARRADFSLNTWMKFSDEKKKGIQKKAREIWNLFGK